MGEPARKRLKSSNGTISAFSALKRVSRDAKVFDKIGSGSPHVGLTKKPSDARTTSKAATKGRNETSPEPANSLGIEAGHNGNSFPSTLARREMAAMLPSPRDQYSNRPICCSPQELQSLRGLLFPASNIVSNDEDIMGHQKSIDDTGMPQNQAPGYSPTPFSSPRSRLQEQGLAEIYDNGSTDDFYPTETSELCEHKSFMKYPPFVHGTANLLSALLTDVCRNEALQWEELFSHLGRPPLTDHAQEEEITSKITSTQGQMPSGTQEIAAAQSSANSTPVLPSQAFAKKAVYAMAWIRFVNTFVDRDVRIFKAETNSGSQMFTKAEELEQDRDSAKAPEPSMEPNVGLHNIGRDLRPLKAAGSDAEPASFISENPYSLLLSRNEEETPSTSSAEDEKANPHRGISRSQGTMHNQALAIGMPTAFVEVRHRCVHNADMQPVLGSSGLREMVRQGLVWVWERYWKDLHLKRN